MPLEEMQLKLIVAEGKRRVVTKIIRMFPAV